MAGGIGGEAVYGGAVWGGGDDCIWNFIFLIASSAMRGGHVNQECNTVSLDIFLKNKYIFYKPGPVKF